MLSQRSAAPGLCIERKLIEKSACELAHALAYNATYIVKAIGNYFSY